MSSYPRHSRQEEPLPPEEVKKGFKIVGYLSALALITIGLGGTAYKLDIARRDAESSAAIASSKKSDFMQKAEEYHAELLPLRTRLSEEITKNIELQAKLSSLEKIVGKEVRTPEEKAKDEKTWEEKYAKLEAKTETDKLVYERIIRQQEAKIEIAENPNNPNNIVNIQKLKIANLEQEKKLDAAHYTNRIQGLSLRRSEQDYAITVYENMIKKYLGIENPSLYVQKAKEQENERQRQVYSQYNQNNSINQTIPAKPAEKSSKQTNPAIMQNQSDSQQEY